MGRLGWGCRPQSRPNSLLHLDVWCSLVLLWASFSGVERGGSVGGFGGFCLWGWGAYGREEGGGAWAGGLCRDLIRDRPNTTTIMFELISRSPVCHFWDDPGCCIKCYQPLQVFAKFGTKTHRCFQYHPPFGLTNS